MITVDTDIGSSIEQTHYALVPAHEFSISSALHESKELFGQDWAQLETDPYMADGGSYRSRRYGLYQLSAKTGQLAHIPGASFFQSTDINPLNGGEHRIFAPLDANTIKSPFLCELIRFDFAQLTSKENTVGDWLVGVHQIRIAATTGVPGNPTPEGIHRDDETYTVQHLIARQNIEGGTNYFYGNGSEPTSHPEAVWKQQYYFDSYYFDHSLWHNVSPIVCGRLDGAAYRDILLIDFIASSKIH